ncbi:MAG TPA: hypothetical protein VLZ50_09095 [Terracidiphilus sp.]|nr:hypothetical protein [Terracidiphilus sp.]
MHRRTRTTLWIVVAVLAFLAVAVFLRSKAPPEAARLLPESDGIVYVNFRPLRALLHKQLTPPVRVPDYQQFVDATGIDWERDLDEAAVALHRMPDPNGPNGPVAYSMVLAGKLNGKRLNSWLEAHAESRESYAGHTVFAISSEGRTVRVARIGYDMVAISNAPTPEQIHSMLDRHRTAAIPFSGSTLLARHYRDVPLLALAWGVGEIGLPFSESGAIQIFGFKLPLEPDSTIVASLAPALSAKGLLRFRVEEIAASEQIAAQQAAALTSLIALARGFTPGLSPNAANDSLKQLLKSAEVTTKGTRVLATATLSPNLLNGLASGDNAAQAEK